MLKITFINGLEHIVRDELETYGGPAILREGNGCMYLQESPSIKKLLNMRSITNIFLIIEDREYTPLYLFRRKSILGDHITKAMKLGTGPFATFHISCAGSESKEIRQIERYISDTFHLTKSEDADLEISIGKKDSIWEIAIRLTARPLSLRNYRTANIPGGMNPTIAYALNTLCDCKRAKSYLNIFAGSGTLLIEAGIMNKSCALAGFDIDGKHIAVAVQNIKKAQMIKRVNLIKADIFDNPELEKFDVITADLPFGMQISKGEDLEKLYKHFLAYSGDHLQAGGTLGVYTAEFELFEECIEESGFRIIEEVPLRVPTSVGAYMNAKLFVCSLKLNL